MTKLEELNPAPTDLIIYEDREVEGKTVSIVVENLQLRCMALKDQVWINKKFSTNEKADNGLEALNKRLATMTDKEAIFTVIFKLIIGKKYRNYKKFFDKFSSVQHVIEIFYQAFAVVMSVSMPQIEIVDYGTQKKNP